ncbi:hypothetical protein [Haladaptatus sp. NG-SE-30]
MYSETKTWLDGAGALLVAIVYTVANGLPGLIAGGMLVLMWYLLPTLYTFAFGQLLVAALFADGVALRYLIPLELGLISVLVGPVLTLDHPYRRVVMTSGIASVFGIGIVAIYQLDQAYWQAIGILAVVFALGAYGLHRYERVALGLVEENA